MIVSTTFCVLVTLTVVAGFHLVSVMVFLAAVTVTMVTDTPFDTVTVGVVVVVTRTVLVAVRVVGGAVKVMMEL